MSKRAEAFVVESLQLIAGPAIVVAGLTWAAALFGQVALEENMCGLWLAGGCVIAFPITVYLIGVVVCGTLRAIEKRRTQ